MVMQGCSQKTATNTPQRKPAPASDHAATSNAVTALPALGQQATAPTQHAHRTAGATTVAKLETPPAPGTTPTVRGSANTTNHVFNSKGVDCTIQLQQIKFDSSINNVDPSEANVYNLECAAYTGMAKYNPNMTVTF
jgi:hypothetical protein